DASAARRVGVGDRAPDAAGAAGDQQAGARGGIGGEDERLRHRDISSHGCRHRGMAGNCCPSCERTIPMPLPQTMTHIEMVAPGGPEVLRTTTGPAPSPKSDEVLIRVLAAGVNRPDVAQRSGLYPPPPGASKLL